MSREVIQPDDADLGHLAGSTILTGEDLKIVQVYQSSTDAQVVKSLRLPTSLYDEAVARNHPAGFSGVVRDALAEFLGKQPDLDEVQAALEVIKRAVAKPAA